MSKQKSEETSNVGIVPLSSQELAKTQTADLEAMFQSPEEAAQSAAELLAQGGELATQVVTMQEGQSVRGVYMGWGAPFPFQNESTGEIRDVKSVLIKARSGKATARLIGNHDLVSKLDGIPVGTEVLIVRGGLKSIGKGHTVAQYQIVIGPKPKGELSS